MYDHNAVCWVTLITGRGGSTKRDRGQVKFYPYKKGCEKSFGHTEKGTQAVLSSFEARPLNSKPY